MIKIVLHKNYKDLKGRSNILLFYIPQKIIYNVKIAKGFPLGVTDAERNSITWLQLIN